MIFVVSLVSAIARRVMARTAVGSCVLASSGITSVLPKRLFVVSGSRVRHGW